MAARMFEGCGNSRNLVSQLVDPDCAAGVVAKPAHTPTAISRPERRCIVSSCVRRFYSVRLSGNAVPVRPGCLALKPGYTTRPLATFAPAMAAPARAPFQKCDDIFGHRDTKTQRRTRGDVLNFL